MRNLRNLFLVAFVVLIATTAMAQGTAPATTTAPAVRWELVAAVIALGAAASAGAIGQGRAIAAACEGIARNPSAGGAIRTAMIIGLALIESLVIYALVVALISVFK